MALPVGSLSPCTLCVGLSTDGTTYTDFSDYISVVEPPEQTRISGQQAVLGEDVHIVTNGPREPIEIRIRGVYVDATATTNPFSLLLSQWDTACGGNMFVRWAPPGCITTAQVFSTGTATTDQSKLIALTYPGGDASDANPVMYEAVIKASKIYRATYAA